LKKKDLYSDNIGIIFLHGTVGVIYL